MTLVENWWKAWSIRIAAAGLALPEILQVIANNSELLVFLPPDWRGYIYMAALIGAILVRPIKQKSMEPHEFE
ncbi:MAG: hypothetical protein Q7V53_07270 [Caldisericota bacterium]|nr:hypothetical protein [Caldisericota bacterium]